MEMKKFKNSDLTSRTLCHVVEALATACGVSTRRPDSRDFQERCVDAILACGNQLLTEYVEPRYAPETRKFRVSFDVKRNRVHSMEVEAESKEEAKAKAAGLLAVMDAPELDDMKTEFLAADVIDAEEVRE